MKKRFSLLLILGLLVISMAMLTSGCGKEDDGDSQGGQGAEVEDTALYCPLDHDELSSMPENVFAVAIDNGAKSEPQTGLNAADVVFELPVEGGITRFLAVFYHSQPDVIGPVRSARHYYIDLVQSLNASYVHCGGSYIAKEDLAAGAVADVDEMANSSAFWRDNSRQKPTNLYTSWENLDKLAKDKDLPKATDLDSYSFYDSAEAEALTMGQNTSISIPYTYKSVSYEWDEASQRYLRFSKEEPHMDAADDTQIYADNVVILHNNATIIDPNGGLLDMSFTNNSGTGYIFQRGNVVPIKWSMAEEYSPLVLTKEDGSPAQLLPGKTFFQVIINEMNVTYNGDSGATTAPAE